MRMRQTTQVSLEKALSQRDCKWSVCVWGGGGGGGRGGGNLQYAAY